MWQVEYYKNIDNKEPVKEWLSSFDNKTKTKIKKYFERLERKKLNLSHTFIKHLETQLYEISIDDDKRVFKIIFFPNIDKKIIILHAYTKNITRKSKEKIVA